MALPPAHSWGWLRFMLNEHPVLKHTRDGVQRLPEAVERLQLVWASSCAPHWPPTLRPRAALMLWRENKQEWGSTGSPWELQHLSRAYLPPALPWGMLRKSSLLLSLSSHPSSFPMPRQLLLRKVFLGTAHNIPALFRLKSLEVGPGSSPGAACPLQAVMQCSRSPAGLCEFISTPVTHTHTHTHRMCLASEAADAGFIPSLVASDWHKCWELLVENCLWALGQIQTPLKTKERLVIALELALDQSHYLCPESSAQTKQQGLGHWDPVPGGPSHPRKREAGRCIWAFLKTSSQGPPRRGLALGTWSQPSLVGGDALLGSRHPDFCAQDWYQHPEPDLHPG